MPEILPPTFKTLPNSFHLGQKTKVSVFHLVAFGTSTTKFGVPPHPPVHDVYYFQYWLDMLAVEERKRMTEVVGPVSLMTKSEAERKKLEFFAKLELNWLC